MSQGKEWDKDKIIDEVLKPLFQLGYNVNKACEIAGFPRTTYTTWEDHDEELRQKRIAWQSEPNIEARKQWVKAIKQGRETSFGVDTYTPAKEWLERVEKEVFSTKQETDNLNKNVDVPMDESLPPEERLKQILDRIKEAQE